MPSIQIGDFKITRVRAGTHWWDGGVLFGVVPKALWSKHAPCDEQNRIEAAFNCFVIEDGSKTILVETGGGVRHDERARERMKLPNPVGIAETLSQNGFNPEKVDYVVNTHLHWDHCSGNTVDQGGKTVPAIPGARYLTHRGEVEHGRMRLSRDFVAYLPANYEPLIEQGRMQLLDGDHEIMPGVDLLVTKGHTEQMLIVRVRSGGKTYVHFADLAPFAIQVTPTWMPAFDLYPLDTIATKCDVMKRAAAEGWVCSFAHEMTTAFGTVTERQEKFSTVKVC